VSGAKRPTAATKCARSKAGAKDFISKPFDMVEVLLRVHNLLEVRLLLSAVKVLNSLLGDCSYCRKSATANIPGNPSRTTSAAYRLQVQPQHLPGLFSRSK